MPRKLVTVRAISDVRRLKGTRFDVATLDGWTVVMPSSCGFDKGQHVVYFEVGSFVPASDGRFWEFSHSFTTLNGERGYHVRTVTVREQVSQGLVFELLEFPEISDVVQDLQGKYGLSMALEMARRMSFEDKLGVVKWEVPDSLSATVLRRVPTFFPRPGCERVQNIPELFTARYLYETFQITEKLDGASMTVYSVTKGSKWYRALDISDDADHDDPTGAISGSEEAPRRTGICSRG
ncbi:MAG: hypothetical protein OK454_05595 [Thaumarchaeota archaeon]|nr:hypothetical protein [Nitrososphaerota archaeon]